MEIDKIQQNVRFHVHNISQSSIFCKWKRDHVQNIHNRFEVSYGTKIESKIASDHQRQLFLLTSVRIKVFKTD